MAVIIPPPLCEESLPHTCGAARFVCATFPLRWCRTTSVYLFLFHLQSLPVYHPPPPPTRMRRREVPFTTWPPDVLGRSHPPGLTCSTLVPVCSHTCISLCHSVVYDRLSSLKSLCLLHLHLASLDVLDMFQHASRKSSSYY